MNFAAAIRKDYTALDDLEAVNVTSFRKSGSLVDVSAKAMRRALSVKEKSTSYGAYEEAALNWWVPDDELSENIRPLKPRDSITDGDNTIWTVLTSEKLASKSMWRLGTVNLSIVYDLQDLVDVQQPLITYDASGAKIKQWPDTDGVGKVLYSQLSARAQLVTEEFVEERGIKGFKGTHAVIVSRQLAFDSSWHENRIRWIDQGVLKYLEILAYHNAERIDELPVLDCELAP